MSEQRWTEMVVISTDKGCRVTVESPATPEGVREAVASALEAANGLGYFHESVDEVTIKYSVRSTGVK